MLENRRYNAALCAMGQYYGSDLPDQARLRTIFFAEQYRTQIALARLATSPNPLPSELPCINKTVTHTSGRTSPPYVIDVLGMPNSGKTGMMDRYLRDLEKGKKTIVFIPEGAQSIKGEYGKLLSTNPWAYANRTGMVSRDLLIRAISGEKEKPEHILTDRGQVDLRVWRRAHFLGGRVPPETMLHEPLLTNLFETVPIGLHAIVMCLVTPEESLARDGGHGTGPIMNRGFLERLYEQYLRLHSEILNGQVPCSTYACIDSGPRADEVYGVFRNIMDAFLPGGTIFSHETSLHHA